MLAYAALACWTTWLYAFGPALALLRHELGFSYTTLGAYSALLSGGAAVAGAGFAAVARRVARGPLLWGSALGTSLAAGLFLLGRGIAVTMVGAGLLGLGGTVLLATLQAVLSDGHGERRERALTEANIGAAASAVLAPLALGASAASGLGWRAVLVLPAVGFGGLWLRYRHEPLPVPARSPEAHSRGGIPLACGMFAVLTAITVAVEFCLVYFGPQLLVGTGMSAAAAGTALSSNYLGILVGRVGGGWLTRAPGRSVVLLQASLAVTAAGFVLFWLSGAPVPAVVGLFVAGVGVANLYPLSLSLVLGAAEGHEDVANARTQLAAGVVSAAAPYLLGSLADAYGLRAGFGLEPVLLLGCLVLLLAGLRARR
ncbi:putative MFS family arabinose efflux permease [Motilibacter rhizosphaerae]|uniref:Putative MFS family arabinose efflux permease n=1 Tax=Motilibacter rhizosphaerae TaxID=598652 RepID=A0A4Q7NTT0_9ACTN|nr:putative MFS family arabinose efflux permease [Motilibacter rhizosphaerae]